MPDFKSLYFQLFAAIADAVDLLDKKDNSAAKARLIRVMQESEEQYLDEPNE